MSARSTMTAVTGTIITAAHGNLLRDHIVPSTGSNDVSSHGQLAVNTATYELVVHDGVAGATRLGHYRAAGRRSFYTDARLAVRYSSFFSDGDSAAPSGSLCSCIWQDIGSSNPAGWITDAYPSRPYTTNEIINVPVAGVYSGWIRLDFTSSWAAAGDYLRVEVGAQQFTVPISSSTGEAYISWSDVPLTAGAAITHAFLQLSGSTRTVAGAAIYVQWNAL